MEVTKNEPRICKSIDPKTRSSLAFVCTLASVYHPDNLAGYSGDDGRSSFHEEIHALVWPPFAVAVRHYRLTDPWLLHWPNDRQRARIGVRCDILLAPIA